MFAIPVARGCGKRKPGGCYAEVGLSPNGKPVEYFLCDPPVLLNGWKVSSVGVQLIEVNGVYHILDVVGQQHYPGVADFIEEVRRFGVSRRLPGVGESGGCSLDYSKLTLESRLLLAHRRAWIANIEDYPEWECPKEFHYHDRLILIQEPEPSKRMCAGLWWRDLDVRGTRPSESDPEYVWRDMPSFEYLAHLRPQNLEPRYRLAIFARFPISRLVVLQGSSKTDRNYQEISKSKLRTNIVEE